MIFVTRIAFRDVNKENIPVWRGIAKGDHPDFDSDENKSHVAKKLLDNLSKIFPGLFKSQMQTISSSLLSTDDDEAGIMF